MADREREMNEKIEQMKREMEREREEFSREYHQ
jgi:hypothetical protein